MTETESAAPAPAPTTASAGAATAGNTGTVVTLEQLAAIVAALSGSVSTLTSQVQASQAFQTQIADGLKSLTENVNKLAVATDSDSGYLVRSSIDPAAGQRRMEALAEMAVADAIEFRKGCDALILRKISQDSDHHGAIPPIAPRSATGPGTAAS